MPLALAQGVEAGVDQDAVDPRRERRFTGEGRRGAVDLEKSILHGVFGVADVAKMVVCDAFHPIAVLSIELLECRGVAARTLRSEPSIVVGGNHRRGSGHHLHCGERRSEHVVGDIDDMRGGTLERR